MRKYISIGYVETKALNTVTTEDIKALDVINLAFGHIVDGKAVYDMGENAKEIARIKAINPNIKIILSIGGWSAGGFSEAAWDKSSRELFAKTAVEIVKKYRLDGLDIDWEYPCISVAEIVGRPQDKENFTLMLKELRESLDTVDTNYYLTIAAGGDSYYTRCTNMAEAQKYLNYVQLMTYDLRGGFCTHTGHHANLFTKNADLSVASADEAVKCFNRAGVPMEKLVVGVAYYSRMWKNVPNRDSGLMQMAGSTGGYGPSYSELVDSYIDKNGFKSYWDDEAKAPWLFDGSTFISYEDEASISEKAKYVRENRLCGLMYWEYSLDASHKLTTFLRSELDK